MLEMPLKKTMFFFFFFIVKIKKFDVFFSFRFRRVLFKAYRVWFLLSKFLIKNYKIYCSSFKVMKQLWSFTALQIKTITKLSDKIPVFGINKTGHSAQSLSMIVSLMAEQQLSWSISNPSMICTTDSSFFNIRRLFCQSLMKWDGIISQTISWTEHCCPFKLNDI